MTTTQIVETFTVGVTVRTRAFAQEVTGRVVGVVNTIDANGEPLHGYLVDIGTGVPVSRLAEEVWPVPVHKTRTFLLSHEVYWRQKPSGRMRHVTDQASKAECTCGWQAAYDTREIARFMARQHREEHTR